MHISVWIPNSSPPNENNNNKKTPISIKYLWHNINGFVKKISY